MVTREENELITRVEGDAPMGKLIRENCLDPVCPLGQPRGGRGTDARPTPGRELRVLACA